MNKYRVYDKKTNETIGVYKNKTFARHKVDNLDNEYGGYRYGCELMVDKTIENPQKGYIISNEAWYCQDERTKLPEDEIMIGKYYNDGGCTGEFAVRWNDIAPRLEVYSDGFKTLADMPELLETLYNMNSNFTPQELKNTLTDIGYQDLTEYNIKL